MFHNHPIPKFTVEIARELARDEEFIKDMMVDLVKKGLVTDIRKNPKGVDYIRRIRWTLSKSAYSAYKSL